MTLFKGVNFFFNGLDYKGVVVRISTTKKVQSMLLTHVNNLDFFSLNY
jgi:hypothetical protein